VEDTNTVNIQDYIDLYNQGIKLDGIKPLNNQTYKLFKESGLDIRIIKRSQTYANARAYSKIKYFVKNNEFFYMIPVTTVKGTIVGFIVRGVLNSDYNTVSRTFSSYEAKVPLMFGFDRKFLLYDKQAEKGNKCYPIIVCEGSKDCMMLKKIYPYVLANNTSSMGLNAQVLRNISDSFLLAYDNDQAGEEGIEKDKKILRNLGAYVESIKLHKGFKDCADYLGHPEEFSELTTQIKRKLKSLYQIRN
jgi:DNA primase